MLNNVEADSKMRARLIKQFKNHETKIEYFCWNFSLEKRTIKFINFYEQYTLRQSWINNKK